MKRGYRLRKDKINSAVHEAMKKAANHSHVTRRLDDAGIDWLEPHRKGYDMDYLKTEQRLSAFFTHWCSGRLPSLEDHFGEKTPQIAANMKRIFRCKGMLHNRKNKRRCHHPLCPLCYHRKFYKLINDLKPYMSKGRSMHVFMLTEYAELDTIEVIFDGLEARAKRFVREISPYTEQWIRIPHLAYDTEAHCFVTSCLFYIVPIDTMVKSDLIPLYRKYVQKIDLKEWGVIEASLDSMPKLLTETLCYDPRVLIYGGSWVMGHFDIRTPWFRYRAKHAHG